jgi:hypothetical protein
MKCELVGIVSETRQQMTANGKCGILFRSDTQANWIEVPQKFFDNLPDYREFSLDSRIKITIETIK